MVFPESGVLHLQFKTSNELQAILLSIEEPYTVINIYGVSPSRHYVALKKVNEDNLKEVKKIKKDGG